MKPGHHKALKKEINVCLPPEREVVMLRNTATGGNLIRDNVLSIDYIIIYVNL